MPYTVDAKGLACPQPVIMAKKALEEHGDIVVLVDNRTSVENLSRLGKSRGCAVEVKDLTGGVSEIRLVSGDPAPAAAAVPGAAKAAGPTVFAISQDRMGRGDDELGYVLVKAFLHTLTELDTFPDVMVFYNTGVKLAVTGSEVIDDLKKLEEMGVEILVCGTCLNYFNITDRLAAGRVSNMYDIAGAMAGSGRLVMP